MSKVRKAKAKTKAKAKAKKVEETDAMLKIKTNLKQTRLCHSWPGSRWMPLSIRSY